MTEEFEKKENSFWSYFIKHHKVAYILGVLIILWGTLALITIPKESAPNIPYGIVVISTPYSGASAQDVDTLITQEIESKIKSINGIKSIKSTSQIGLSNITVEFDPDHNMITGVSDIRSKIDEALPSLPDSIDKEPIVREISSEQQPFFSIIIHGDAEPVELHDLGEKLKREVEKVSGVSEVQLSGGKEREIVVDIDPILLHTYGLTINDVTSSISSSHRNTPLGDLEIDELNYNLRIEGRHQTTSDIKNVYIKNTNQEGTGLIKVSDVAKIYEAGKDTNSIQRYIEKDNNDPQNYAELSVLKANKTNIFTVNAKAHELAQEYADKNFPKNVKISFVQEIEPYIREDFNTVFKSGVSSAIVVLLLIFIFVGFKEGMIAGLVIPLTFLVTIGISQLLGNTLNFMSNFSMILALGILVDTAIVIVEGCHDYVRRGKSAYEAAILALHEYKNPLISGTLTTLAVFIPLFTLPGVLGKYLTFIPITVTIVLASALAISLLLIPSYSSKFLKPSTTEKPGAIRELARSAREKFTKGQKATIKRYYKIVNAIIESRFLRIGLIYLIITLFALSWLIPIKFELFPSGDAPFMSISVEKAIGTTPEETAKTSLRIEEQILAYPEVKLVKTNVSGNTASIYIELFAEKERKEKKQRTSNELVFAFQEEFKTVKDAIVQTRNAQQGPPSEFPVGFRIIANDISQIDKAEQVAKDLKEILKEIPGTSGVSDDVEMTPGEIKYTINHDKALALGINPTVIASSIRTALKGVTAATITKENIDIDVNVKYGDEYIDDLNKISNIMLPDMQGNLININEVIDYEIDSSLSNIKRVETELAFTISSLLTEDGNAVEITDEFLKRIENYQFPDGISITVAGENEENAELLEAFGSGFVIAIMIMFLILVVQFNSLLQPIIILSTIIFAMIGVNIGLYITGTIRSLAFILGTIALAGIVVNDAIILLDQINRKRSEGLELKEAIVRAGRTRFTPIILTSLTTTAGIAPLVLVDVFWAGLSYTVIFGLMVASFLTLFVTPAMYYQLENEKVITFMPLVTLLALLGGIGTLFGGIYAAAIPLILIGLISFYISRRGFKKLTS